MQLRERTRSHLRLVENEPPAEPIGDWPAMAWRPRLAVVIGAPVLVVLVGLGFGFGLPVVALCGLVTFGVAIAGTS